ncbi:hypothetical protein [uncultured Croceitalea sp.]|uniref:hypothetical protein n=1 Tax=uncultured Croceitalea sp. TaxID=1798908 RepID=UPI00330674A9
MKKIRLVLLAFTIITGISFAQSTNEREIIDELIEKLEDNKCLDLLVSSVSVKKERGEERAFTTYGTSELRLQNGNTLRSQPTGIATNFSDREVSGYPTREHIYIVYRNNKLTIKVRFESWGDKTVELKDATIVKREQGYFATGNHYNGRRVVYYNITIFDDFRRGCIGGLPRK